MKSMGIDVSNENCPQILANFMENIEINLQTSAREIIFYKQKQLKEPIGHITVLYYKDDNDKARYLLQVNGDELISEALKKRLMLISKEKRT